MRSREEEWVEIQPGLKVGTAKYVRLATGRIVTLEAWNKKSAWKAKKPSAIKAAAIASAVAFVATVVCGADIPHAWTIAALLAGRAAWAAWQARGVVWAGEDSPAPAA